MTTSSPTPPTDRELYQHGERLLNTMLDSADRNALGVRYWDRAKTALETGAATTSNFRQMVAKVGKKLQINTLSEASSAAVGELQQTLDVPATFARFRTICTRDALIITANARNARLARKKEPK